MDKTKKQMNESVTSLTFEELCKCSHPSENEIWIMVEETGQEYYHVRELLRERVYGGKPPGNFQSWGDYWKSI